MNDKTPEQIAEDIDHDYGGNGYERCPDAFVFAVASAIAAERARAEAAEKELVEAWSAMALHGVNICNLAFNTVKRERDDAYTRVAELEKRLEAAETFITELEAIHASCRDDIQSADRKRIAELENLLEAASAASDFMERVKDKAFLVARDADGAQRTAFDLLTRAKVCIERLTKECDAAFNEGVEAAANICDKHQEGSDGTDYRLLMKSEGVLNGTAYAKAIRAIKRVAKEAA